MDVSLCCRKRWRAPVYPALEGLLPELPEVEVVRTGLESLILGRRITHLHLHRRTLRYPLPEDMAARLTGRSITAVSRRSKYLVFHLDGPDVLVWHLGMTGQFHVLPDDAPPGRHEHVVFDLDRGLSLRYRDMRRFGYAGLFDAGDWRQQPWFAELGPEPLEDGFDGGYLYGRCRARKAPIKVALMDAAVVVGVGNIYACESLFRAGIDPFLPAHRLGRKRAAALAAAVKAVLHEAIAAGGSTISDFVRADGRPGYFRHSFAVYQRQGQPCVRCGGLIRRRLQSGRGTFHCPGCQR
jgi:formamidopyrimidine-DNA glycosylase